MKIINKKIALVIPTVAQDIPSLERNFDLFFRHLPISKIVLLSNVDVYNTRLINDYPIEYINENKIVPYNLVSSLINNRYNGTNHKNRVGWYVQQFLKIGYAQICSDEYYLLWDSDTIPLRHIDLFNKKGQPYLDYKTEYHKPYFDTMSILLPGFYKIFKGSFIAEHMLVNTKHMKELINLIESNNNIEGDLFYEKIINSISLEHLQYSGFSEFETYGTFVLKQHPEKYILRRWHSFRYGGFFFENNTEIKPSILEWLSKDYHALSIEKTHNLSWIRHLFIWNLRHFFPAKTLEILSYVPRILCRI